MSCFWGHKWGKWEQYTEQHTWINKDMKASPMYYVKKQKRACLVCNKMEVEKVEEQ